LINGIESNNIVYNFHVLSFDKIFIQVNNNCDKYFINECGSEFLKFVKLEGLSYNITEYSMNGTTPLKEIKGGLFNEKVELKPLDFKLFLIEF